MSKTIKWNSGPPPHTGWWQASIIQDSILWRWWDCKKQKWSIPVNCFDNAKDASICSAIEANASGQKIIKWTTYWPKNARVPRIDPRKGE